MMRRGLWIALAVVAVIVLAGLLVFGSFVSAQKQMVAKQVAVQAQWANVQTALQRRADLIPNLVATVKGYATHEETVFADVDKAREAQSTQKIGTTGRGIGPAYEDKVGRRAIRVCSENYPNLKANENFLQLQDSLEGTENRISVERHRYNETLQDYNTFIGQIPNNIWAHLAGFKPNNAYFEASPASQAAPQVHF